MPSPKPSHSWSVTKPDNLTAPKGTLGIVFSFVLGPYEEGTMLFHLSRENILATVVLCDWLGVMY